MPKYRDQAKAGKTRKANELFSLKLHVSGRRKVTELSRFSHLFQHGRKDEPSAAATARATEQPVMMFPEEEPEQSVQSSKKDRLLGQWEALQEEYVQAYVESAAIPGDAGLCQLCLRDGKTILGNFRCPDCGPMAIYCDDCVISAHNFGQLHFPERWGEYGYVRVRLPLAIWRRTDHDCNTGGVRPLTVIDSLGRQHRIDVSFCEHESATATLARFSLWPSAPDHPRLAFHFEFMEKLRIFMLECQVSVTGFWKAMTTHDGFTYEKFDMTAVDKTLLLAYHQYLQFRRNRDILRRSETFITTCQACPKSSGQFTMDGCFGLPRKSSAGAALTGTRQHRYFQDQTEVNTFVQNHVEDSRSKECSMFEVGNILRGSSNKKIDEQGVFGVLCRHSFPVAFCDMTHRGEKFGYPVFMLKHLTEDLGMKKILVHYDVGCQLGKHLKKQLPEMLEDVKLVVPAFHTYGHNVQCQVTNGSKYNNGVGMMDGEGCERLWSYLRRFMPITKEMTADNRRFILSEALQTYADRSRLGLATSLANKMKRAMQECLNSSIELEAYNVNREEDEVKDIMQRFTNRDSVPTEKRWEEEYVLALYELESSHCAKLLRKVKRMEKDYKIVERWAKEDAHYKENLAAAIKQRRKSVLQECQLVLQDRAFLFNLKKTHAVGQAVCKKIELSLKKTVTKLERLQTKYNRDAGHPTEIFPDLLCLDYIYNVDEWKNYISTTPIVPMEEEIALLTHKLRRAREERDLVAGDMNRLYENRCVMHQQLQQRISNLRKDDMTIHQKGELVILKQEAQSMGQQINDTADRFSPFLHFPHVQIEGDIQMLLDTTYNAPVSEDEIVGSCTED